MRMKTLEIGPVMKTDDYRKIVKPLLERRRRVRINHSLTELKSLLTESNPTLDNNESSRLEKADILELTVRQVKEFRIKPKRPVDMAKFRAGFMECANDIALCVTTMPGLNESIRSRLIAHLTGRPVTEKSHELNSLTPPPSPHDYAPPSPAPSPIDLTRGHLSPAHFNYPRMNQQPTKVSPWRPW